MGPFHRKRGKNSSACDGRKKQGNCIPAGGLGFRGIGWGRGVEHYFEFRSSSSHQNAAKALARNAIALLFRKTGTTRGLSVHGVSGRYGRRRRPDKPMIKEIRKMMIKIKKSTLAIM